MSKPYDFSALPSRLYGLEPDSPEGFSETLQPVSFSGSKLINPVFSAEAPTPDSASSAPDMGAMAALFQSDPATILAQALFTAMVGNGHVFESQSNGCACCGHDHGVNAKTQIMNLDDQIQQLLDSGLDISDFSTLIDSISALGDVDADIFANSLQETAKAFAKAILDAANELTNGDLPADTSTTGTITIGGSASGTRGSGTDEDWYAVELQAGVQYTFIMLRDGDNPHEDPLLILYNSAGTEIDRNDDVEINGVGANRNSFITFTPDESGTYYLGASGWMATTGDYTVYAGEGDNRPDFTLDQAAFFLTSQYDNEAKWDKTDLTYDISALSDGARTLALMAMDAWAEVSGLTFTAAAAGANPDIDFNEDNGANGARQAFAGLGINADDTIISATITISANWDTNSDGSADYALNSLRYQTYLHEVGHALGLGHSGLYNGRDVDEAGVSYHVYNQDAWNYTVMSYRHQGEAGTGTPRLVLAPQLVDIIAIQNFYGVNGQTRSGDSVYGFNSTETGVLDFEGTFFNQGIRPPSLAIYDAGGTDTLDVSGYSANQVISLVEGSFSSIGDNIITDDPEDPLINNITIAVGTVIENAIGGSGDDSFIGNDSNNVFTGNGGNDTYTGGAGNDMVILALSQSRYTISVDETNGGRFLVISGGTEGTDRINLADVEFVGFNGGQTIVTTAALADPVEFDDDGDGIIDRSEAYIYDGDGNRIRTLFDDDNDGTIDRSETYTYNSDGGLIRTRFDDDNDGIIDRSEAYIYDGDGNRIRTRFDDDNDGNIDRIAFDPDGDGNFDRINHYTFDDGGTRRVTRRDFDLDDDGNIDRIAHVNADGRWQRVELDADDDGNIDRIDHYTFAADGSRSLTRTDFDDDDDGNFDRSEAYIYNGDGNRIRTRFDDDNDGNIDRIAFDPDGDGNFDRINHYTIDDDGTGRVTRRDSDLDDDGNIDRIAHVNADGRWERVELDADDDGNIDRINHYTFAADGSRSLTRTGFDDDGDGNFDRSEAYIYNGDGNRIRTRFDDDNDGNIDRIAFDPDGDGNFDRINHYTIDDDGTGRVTRRDSDLDDDGNIDRIAHVNADGRWERVELDADDDGNIDRINHYTFDDDGTGRVIRRDSDLDDDGNIDRTVHLNADGRWERVELDTDDDGNIDRIDHYTFAVDGTRSLTRRDFDDDGDGNIDRSEAYTHDGDGNRTRTDFDDNNDGTTDRAEFDDDDDGTSDRTEFYTHNSDGVLIRTRFDDDNDGNIDRIAFDPDGDGNPDRINHYTIDDDGNGRVTRRDSDLDDDGTIDRTAHVNADGRWERVERDLDDDGNIDRSNHYVFAADGTRSLTRSEAYTYDGDGNRTRTRFDDDGDGIPDRSEAYTYDANGRLIQTDFDDGGDGRIDRSITYTYDANGRLIQTDFDDDGDGRIDRSERALSSLDGTNGFTLTGIDAGDNSGRSVSSAGDVNGDGYDDLIIGAPRAAPEAYLNRDRGAGETYIVYGGASAPGTNGVLDLSDLDGTNGFTLTGIDAYDESGRSVSSAGDVNGDGYDDLIIGAIYADPNGDSSAGETYVVYGGASAPGTDGVLDLSALDGTNGFILNGIDANDLSGSSVSSAGDVNGDGYDDLIIGARWANPNGDSEAGETYVLYGGASAPGSDGVLDLSGLDGSNGFILTGIDAGDRAGSSVSSAGDVNGDGYDDLIIGANRADPNGNSYAGETYIVYGGASAPGSDGVLDLGALDGTNGFIVNGIDAYDRSGISVSSAGDVNGDGYDDLIIGAYQADPNGNNGAGETYVIYGGATGTESLVPVTASGTAAADNFTGNAGTDSFTGIATNDVVRGGAGDDTIRVTALDFATIDGGTGVDTLVLAGAGLALDLTGAGHAGVDSVEVFDLSGTGANSLVLDAQAVFDVTEEREGGVARLDVLGDADDSVDLSGSNFALTGTVTEDGTTYHVYRDGNAQLRIEDGVQVQNPRLITLSVAENQSAAYMYRVPDAEGDTLVYSLSGTDAALFTIDANTGEVRFREAPDFEAPGDDGGDNVYDIIATVSDGTTDTEQAVAIRVTNENDNIPVFTSPAAASVAEGQSAVYRAAATDADGDALVYSLSGTDAALFTIDATTGEVSFIEAPDFEAPGDDDGDNVYDIVVTASDGTNHTEQAVAITVTDEENDLIPLSSLDGTNGFILNGIDLVDRSGLSVSSAGDVNGDGYDDLIIGASGGDPNGESSGESYVVYGGARAPGTEGVLDLSDLDGTNGFILNGIDAGDNSGISVSSAGDVNGDGYDDLIIGASGGGLNGVRAGETYVIYGGASAPGSGGVLDLSTLDGTNGFILTGIDFGDGSGRSVSSAGDVNGDGYDDLVIGAPFADPNGDSTAGETYVVYGGARAPGTEGVLDLSTLDGTNGFTLTGIDRYGRSGISVSSAGDVNGDGYDDLVIGARWANGIAGETYVVYGGASAPGTGGVLDLSTLDGTNGFTLNGIDFGDYSGWSVSSAGDVNGDGYDDLIIGASGGDPNGDSTAGETYIVYGGASAPGTGGVLDLSALDGTNGFTLTGIDADDRAGRSVSSAGDVNGDGYDDLIIGAYGGDPNGRSSAGESYVLYGGANAPGTNGVLDLGVLNNGINGFILTGIDAGDNSGTSVSSAGDVNGDGYDDLIIGASGADPNASLSGETYILYGGATGTESLMPVTAQGTAAADNFTGNAGDDSFTAIATDDVVRGGAGDDRISVTALDFAAIDGGTGVDTLVLDGAGLALDLTGPGNAGVDSVEVFDLSGTGANSLVLDAQAVFDVTEEREDGLASLDVLGDADDSVDLSGSSFALSGTVTEDGVTYNVYRDGNAQLRIEDGVSVTLAAAGAQSARSLTADPDRILPDLSHADAWVGIDGTGLHSPGHSPGMDVDFMDGFSEPEFEWTGVVVTGLAPPDMQAPDPLSSGQAINPFDVLTGYDLSYDLLL